MKSQNYNEALSYFAVRYARPKKDNYLAGWQPEESSIFCYGIQPDKLADLQQALRENKNATTSAVKKMIAAAGAKENDFYDAQQGRIVPGRLVIKADVVRSVTFCKDGLE